MVQKLYALMQNKCKVCVSQILVSLLLMDVLLFCTKVTLTKEPYGCAQCKDITRYTWTTESGLSVSVINYGGIISNICLPDQSGKVQDVALGFDDIDNWSTANGPYFGCTVGRCANIISRGKFRLEGRKYKLPKNNGKNSLHGGLIGFDKVVWNDTLEGNRLTLSYLSEDGEEGYPGDLITNVTFEVCDSNIVHVDFLAQTNKPTVVNLTNHTYFNLAGHDAGHKGLYDHCITINANSTTKDGAIKPVKKTPFDLRKPTKLASAKAKLPDLFDNNFCINTFRTEGIRFLACAFHEPSGRFLEIHSDSPGLQFYTGNFLPSGDENSIVGKGGCCYKKHGGFCLQPQEYPDAINNQDKFPSPILYPGCFFKRRIKYKFGVHKEDDDNKSPSMKLRCPRC